jgi:hypothetical protein
MKYSDFAQHKQPYYSVVQLFFDKTNSLYEERTILVKAATAEKAFKKADADAREHEASLDSV